MTAVKTSAIAVMALGAAICSAQNITVTVDGKPVGFNNTTPRYMQGRVLVPLRGVFEEMGAYVQWDAATRTVSGSKGDKDVKLRIGEKWAMVDGKNVALDVPAMIVGGSTMVPIRFISESLGAQVQWHDPSRTVMINTMNGIGSTNTNNNTGRPITFENRRRFIIREGSVIPVSLNTGINSRDARRGDRITATIRDFNASRDLRWDDESFDLPEGTIVEGRVLTARPQAGSDPGILELQFNRLRMPDGRTATIDGSLISLDSKDVARNESGVLVAKASANRDNRTVYAGYGAGAGLIVGLLTKRPLENAALGGLLGYVVGTLQRDQQRPRNVELKPGTQFGVRVNQDVALQLDTDK